MIVDQIWFYQNYLVPMKSILHVFVLPFTNSKARENILKVRHSVWNPYKRYSSETHERSRSFDILVLTYSRRNSYTMVCTFTDTQEIIMIHFIDVKVSLSVSWFESPAN